MMVFKQNVHLYISTAEKRQNKSLTNTVKRDHTESN